MSKNHHVYGIGNALVDYEYEVSPQFLEQMDIDKGLMTLVDEQRQHFLLGQLDNFQHQRSCGGSAANTMIAIGQLGGNSFYSCKVASDEAGRFYYEDLLSNGVKTNLGRDTLEEGVTGKCMVFVTPDADRTMNSFLGITSNFSMQEVCEENLIQAEYLYIEGYLVTSPTAKEAAIKCRKLAKSNGVKTSLTFSDPGIVEHFKDGFIEIMGEEKLDLLFCNEAEALSFTQESELSGAINKLKDYAHSFAITMGARGAVIISENREIEVLPPKVKAVDTNGAGDLFAGAFLYGITNGMGMGDAGKLACACSSELVTQFGARLSKDKIQDIHKNLF